MGFPGQDQWHDEPEDAFTCRTESCSELVHDDGEYCPECLVGIEEDRYSYRRENRYGC